MNVAPERRGRAGLSSVDAVLRLPEAPVQIALHGRGRLTEAVRSRLTELRATLADDAVPPEAQTVLAEAAAELAAQSTAGVRPVLNATGVVLHTNLGRAPLSAAAREAVLDAAGYATVEFDLASGLRGSRTGVVGRLAAELCEAEAGTAVNNGAAALMLAIAALARGRDVIVSRGELIEIGGEFRLPEIITAAGARLVEVGTTNRTRVDDYRKAIGPDTALLLKVHRSNFRVVGFTEEASVAELAAVAAEHDLPLVFDAGSGLVTEGAAGTLIDEPAARAAVSDGADLVLFSGDKLLGGPQAGLLVGRAASVARCTKDPVARAMRIDKLQLAALEATLRAHLRDAVPMDVPTVAMLHADPERLRARAEALRTHLETVAPGVARATPVTGAVGGGASPGVGLESHGVRITVASIGKLAELLRRGEPPVVARIEDGALILDVRTLPEADDALLHELVADALAEALRGA